MLVHVPLRKIASCVYLRSPRTPQGWCPPLYVSRASSFPSSSPPPPQQTSVLDSSALKTRVQLSKRSRRRAPHRPLAPGAATPSEPDGRSAWEEEAHSAMRCSGTHGCAHLLLRRPRAG